jgi:hypothetical protein
VIGAYLVDVFVRILNPFRSVSTRRYLSSAHALNVANKFDEQAQAIGPDGTLQQRRVQFLHGLRLEYR